MIALALKATLVLLLAVALDLGVLRRRGSAAARHLVWALAVTALLVLPVLTFALPAWRVVELPAVGAGAAPVVFATPEVYAYEEVAAVMQPSAIRTTTASRAAIPPRAVESASARASIDWSALALIVYAGVALVLLLRVVAEHLTV